MKNVLIIGVTGFIGRNLKEYLDNNCYNLSCINHRDLELLDENAVKRFLINNRFDIIIHTATHNATETSLKDINYVLNSNLRMFFNLARCSDYFGKMIYFGSGAEFDKRTDIKKVKEEYFDESVPVDQYGFSKYIMNKCISGFNNIYNLRLFGVFGKYEDWKIRFISNACCKAVFDLPITINQNVFFDYLYVDDLSRIVEKIIDKDLKYKDYNTVTGRAVSLYSIACIVKKISNKDIDIIIKKDGLNKEYTADNSRLIKEIGNFDFTDLEYSIKKLYIWYDENKKQIDKKCLFE
jgi:GDP-L-fucose synthase